MPEHGPRQPEPLRRFFRRVWRADVAPLLRGRRGAQRARAARLGGKLAASAGLLADRMLGLEGRPFMRMLTVLGSSVGAMLPDVWDWDWYCAAGARQRRAVAEHFERCAAELPESDALALFGLEPWATRAELRSAWRGFSKRFHPDRARSAAQRAEFHLRFITCRAAYERLCRAYDDGRLPLRRPAARTHRRAT